MDTAPADATAVDGAPADGVAELADELTRAMKRIRHRTVHRLEPYGLTPARAARCGCWPTPSSARPPAAQCG